MKVPSREHELARANIGQLPTHKVGHSYRRCKSSLNRTAIYLQGFEHRNWAQTVRSVNPDDWNKKTEKRQNRRPMGDYLDEDTMREKMVLICRGLSESIPSSPLALAYVGPSPRMIKASTLLLACVLPLSPSWPSHAPSTAI
jgi:hypothetical protein